MSSYSETGSSESEEDEPSNKRVINVVLIGESGAGKSAVINLTHDANVVDSDDRAVGVTMNSARVSGLIKDHPDLELHLYDTAGLSEGEDGTVPTTKAFVQLIKLCYAIPGGIHLLIFCHPKGRISTKQFKTNYRIFYEDLCEKNMPALLVITHCDNDKPLNRWWDANKDYIQHQLHFTFDNGVCVSTLKNEDSLGQVSEAYKTSRCNLIQAIRNHASSRPVPIDSWKRKFMVYMRTLFNVLADWLQWFGVQQKSLRPELEKMFTDLNFSQDDARKETDQILKELENPDLMGPFQIINTDNH